jgi:hypothetical protein
MPDEKINKAIDFLNDFVGYIKDESKDESQKVSYFANNFAKANKLLTMIKESIDDEDGFKGISPEIVDIIKNTYDITIKEIQNFRDTISKTPVEDKEDVILSEDTVKEALDKNSSTKQMQEDMQNLANKQDSPNYGAIINGSFVQILADSKEDLANYISNIVDKNNININDVKIFELKEIKFTATQVTKININ